MARFTNVSSSAADTVTTFVCVVSGASSSTRSNSHVVDAPGASDRGHAELLTFGEKVAESVVDEREQGHGLDRREVRDHQLVGDVVAGADRQRFSGLDDLDLGAHIQDRHLCLGKIRGGLTVVVGDDDVDLVTHDLGVARQSRDERARHRLMGRDRVVEVRRAVDVGDRLRRAEQVVTRSQRRGSRTWPCRSAW